MHYLASEARSISEQSPPVPLYPVYTEFPKGAKSFVSLYRSFVIASGLDPLVDAFLELTTSGQSDSFYENLLVTAPDLANCLRILTMGSPTEKAVAIRWIRGDSLPLADYRKIGIAGSLKSTEDATLMLATMIEMLGRAQRSRGGQGYRVVWLIDEFQRLDKTGSRIIADFNAGLHSLFNSSPVGLSLIISFSGAPSQGDLPTSFSPELRDRLGTTKVMILPPLDSTAALAFVRDVLFHYRDPKVKVPNEYFPFSEKVAMKIIAYIAAKAELRPRVIMQTFNAILEDADQRIEGGELNIITEAFALSVLDEHVSLQDTKVDG